VSFCVACASTSRGVGEQPNANDDVCEVCPTDSYSDKEGVEFCSACSANIGTVGEGSMSASDCVWCKAGYYMGASECVACAMNTYNPSGGATSASQCIACAEGRKSWKGSANCRENLS